MASGLATYGVFWVKKRKQRLFEMQHNIEMVRDPIGNERARWYCKQCLRISRRYCMSLREAGYEGDFASLEAEASASEARAKERRRLAHESKFPATKTLATA